MSGFRIFQMGQIQVVDDGQELEMMGVVLTGNVDAIRAAGKLMFQDVVLVSRADYDAMLAAREAAQ